MVIIMCGNNICIRILLTVPCYRLQIIHSMTWLNKQTPIWMWVAALGIFFVALFGLCWYLFH